MASFVGWAIRSPDCRSGPNVLNPSAVILADESLPVESRETIKTRIELWIAATTRRILGPLFALEGIQEGSEIVRDLARELVRSLGVLEREPIKAKIKALAQDDRAELRKQGVRFGAYYLFRPGVDQASAKKLGPSAVGSSGAGDASELPADAWPGRLVRPHLSAVGQGDLERRVSRRRVIGHAANGSCAWMSSNAWPE